MNDENRQVTIRQNSMAYKDEVRSLSSRHIRDFSRDGRGKVMKKALDPGWIPTKFPGSKERERIIAKVV
jgi:hypothetical protein